MMAFIPSSFPESCPVLNELINENRKNKQVGAKFKKETDYYIFICIKSMLKNLKIEKSVYIRYTWVEENKKRDKDNIASAKKYVQDALVQAGVLKNDGWNNIVGFEDRFEIDKEKPGVLVEIVEVE
ncbi:RusA family crossover junction endodeoxyribonuclease [Acetobacterium bakii]|nr:RusA family crossover junction endodeoxyribonuclease [Acetobacterium bakii]